MIVRKVVMVCQTYLQLYLLLYSCGVGVIANPLDQTKLSPKTVLRY
jgi:hypothetical protein